MDGEAKLWRKVEQDIGRRVPEPIRQDKYVQDLVKDCLSGIVDPKEAFKDLMLAVVDRIHMVIDAAPEILGLERVRRSAPTHMHGSESTILSVDSPTDLKAAAMLQAMSSFYKGLAQQHPDVRSFREKVLKGRLLGADEAHGFLSSYAARFFPLKWFTTWRIPITGHVAEIMGEYDDGSRWEELDHRVTIRVSPPGIIKRVRYAHPRTPVLDEQPVDDTSYVLRRKVLLPPNEGPSGLPLPNTVYRDRGYPGYLWPGSVVDDLYRLSEKLATMFEWPGKDDAAWFVLTGDAPAVRFVDANVNPRGDEHFGPQWRLQLTLPLWTPSKEVLRSYQQMQKQILKGRDRTRLPDPKTLEVARFVWERESSAKYRHPTWEDLCKGWNREHPEAPFEYPSRFQQSCMRGVEAVTGLNLPAPEEQDIPEGQPYVGPGQESIRIYGDGSWNTL